MEEKLLSVVIPVYNAEKVIRRCIDSIKGEVEIIIMDDGSCDASLDICKEMAEKDARIKVYKQENQGAFVARENGAKKATGKYVMFLDSDDEYMENTITKVTELIQKYQEPDVIRFRYQKEPDGYVQYPYLEEAEVFLKKEDFKETVYSMILEGYQLNSLWGNCIKKSILEEISIPEKARRYGEDLQLNLEIYTKAQTMVFSNEILYRYHTTPDSVTKTRSAEKLLANLQDCILVYSSFFQYIAKWEMENDDTRKAVQKRLQKETDSLITLIGEATQN